MPIQLTPQGLETQTAAEIKQEIIAQLLSIFPDLTPEVVNSFSGQLASVEAEYEAVVQQAIQAVYSSFNPNNAIGEALDQRSAITNTQRKPAQQSFVNGLLTFSAAGVVNDGYLVRNTSTNTLWQAIGGPYVAVGPDIIPAVFQAVEVGAFEANAGTTWALVAPTPGLDSFTNPTQDASVGNLAENDPELRRRRNIELSASDQGSLSTITARVSQRLRGSVGFVRTYHNPNIQPFDPVTGIPFKAFEVVLEPNPNPPSAEVEQAIAEAILSALSAGGWAYGVDLNLNIPDSEGTLQNIRATYVVNVPVYITITLDTTDSETELSENPVSVVQEYVEEQADLRFSEVGRDQLGWEFVSVIGELQKSGELSGISNVVVQLSRVSNAGPFEDPLSILFKERPTFALANIQVTVI